MYLPLTQSSANEILEENLNKVYNNTKILENGKSKVLMGLEELRDKCTTICESMYKEMGYNGNLKQQEQEFNKRLAQAQAPVSFLNGSELYSFMIKELATAAPYSKDYQQAYEKFCKQVTEKSIQEILSEENPASLVKKIYEALDIDLSGMFLTISKDGTHIQGFNPKKGGSTVRFYLDKDFVNQKGQIRKRIIDKIKDSGVNFLNNEGDEYQFSYDEKYFYNLLKLSQTKDKITGASLLDFTDSELNDIFNGVKLTLQNKILNSVSVEKEKMSAAISKVFNTLEPKDLFAGKNAMNKITGLIGEIQAIYLLSILVPNASIKWTAANTEKGLQPHQDLILEIVGSYGVQVKNSVADVKKEISFQSFELKKIEEFLNGKVKFALPDVLTSSNIDKDLFLAASTILAMKNFNIEYQWISSNKKGSKAIPGNNETFKDTREKIVSAAIEAEKAMQMFSAAMMFMQTSNNLEIKQDANSLYLIGGKLAISSATILSNIIDELESEIKSFKVTPRFYSKESKSNYTIVNYFNNNSHKSDVKIALESSYIF